MSKHSYRKSPSGKKRWPASGGLGLGRPHFGALGFGLVPEPIDLKKYELVGGLNRENREFDKILKENSIKFAVLIK